MSIVLEFLGYPGPWRDVEKFRNAVKAANPGLTDSQIMDLVHRENAKKRWRHKEWVFQMFGADILSGDLQSMDAWPYLQDRWKRDLPKFPVEGGEVIRHTDDDAVNLQFAIRTKGEQRVNRRSLMVPDGLSKTYVWCIANNWIQEVSDADAAILRAHPLLKLMFRNPNFANGPMQIQDYRRQSTGERYQFDSIDEAQAFERGMSSRPQWNGFK